MNKEQLKQIYDSFSEYMQKEIDMTFDDYYDHLRGIDYQNLQDYELRPRTQKMMAFPALNGLLTEEENVKGDFHV
jgi:hypothetical protein